MDPIIRGAIIGLAGGVLAAIVGATLVLLYYTHVTNRQKRALILLFAQEFMLLFKRCADYYEQMLTRGQSYSTLFEVSDSATITKLGEVAADTSVIKTIIRLKADFFQIIRWAHRGSRIDPDTQKLVMDPKSLSIALVFFMGDIRQQDDSFGRLRYKEYKQNISNILEYLEKINSSDFDFGDWVGWFSRAKEQREQVQTSINDWRKELDDIEHNLDNLRPKEKKYWITEGKEFAPDQEKERKQKGG